MRSPLLILGHLSLLFCVISGVSIWDPFCKEDILYTPYVRVFQKGRSGALLRDRGPGFIELKGLKDIYVCTNGLVMMYYTKTTGLGEVFEQGELHWTPHHCELYNPSPNEGMVADHPKKTLLSILLIGHPQDYRRPAVQMFVAPMFDQWYKDYVNITSLIMMGTDGECLIEKGAERARLRVRNQLPQYLRDIPDEEPKPPIFCQLDAQRKLGQQGLITLAKPGNAGLKEGDLYEFKERQKGFKGTPLEKEKSQMIKQKRETGSAISPRYHPTNFKEKQFPGALGNFAEAADDVYAALINDRKMRFVGCLRYPDFSAEQMRVIETRKNESEVLDLSKDGLLIKESEPPFWADKVTVPWPDSADPKPQESRYTLYVGVDVEGGDIEAYDDAKKKVDVASDALNEKREKKGEEMKPEDIKAAEDVLRKETMVFSLWPLKKAYGDLYKHVKLLEEQVKAAWGKVHTEAGSAEVAAAPDYKDPEGKKALSLALWRHQVLQNISQTKYDRRYEPYNRLLVEEYDQYENQTSILNAILRRKSNSIGPLISTAETLHSQYRVYKSLLKRAMGDLQEAVRHMERTGKPVAATAGAVDPFDRYFVDTMIEIADAVKEDLSPYEDTNLKARACYELPAHNVSCKGIKPTSKRAGHLLKNRQGKGKDWPRDDQWRGTVLDLIQQIFHKVCPYVKEDFVVAISRLVKGYLLAQPLGTGLTMPLVGSRLFSVDHQYQAIVYNSTYNETDLNNTEIGMGKLRAMQPFWEQITAALEDCKEKAMPMQFWHNEEVDKPAYVTYRKFFQNNGTEAHFDVNDLMMMEKADLEYSFNWAVDISWRIFSTVLGVCMPRYEKTIPLISARFYALYSQDFLQPLRQIWMSNRDNPVFQVILGDYYSGGKGELWAKRCMETSFMESGDRNYRPPRHLYVNAFTEMNYFLSGPLAGTSGMLSVVQNNL